MENYGIVFLNFCGNPVLMDSLANIEDPDLPDCFIQLILLHVLICIITCHWRAMT